MGFGVAIPDILDKLDISLRKSSRILNTIVLPQTNRYSIRLILAKIPFSFIRTHVHFVKYLWHCDLHVTTTSNHADSRYCRQVPLCIELACHNRPVTSISIVLVVPFSSIAWHIRQITSHAASNRISNEL